MDLPTLAKISFKTMQPKQKTTWLMSFLLYGYWVITSFYHDWVLNIFSGIGLWVLTNMYLAALKQQHRGKCSLLALFSHALKSSLTAVSGLGVSLLVLLIPSAVTALLVKLIAPHIGQGMMNFLQVLPVVLAVIAILVAGIYALMLNAFLATLNIRLIDALRLNATFFKQNHGLFMFGVFGMLIVWVLPESFGLPSLLPFTQGLLWLFINSLLVCVSQLCWETQKHAS